MNQPPPPFARRLELSGWLRKALPVPDHHTALLLAEAGPYTLEPGDHALCNWPFPAPEVVLIETGPLPFDLQIEALLSGDGETVALTAPLQVIVSDPLRLHNGWLRLSPGPEWPLPLDAVAGRLHATANELAASYAAADLNRHQVRRALAAGLRQPLSAALAHYGLTLATPELLVQALSQAERVAAAEAARVMRELARDARMEQALSQLESRDMFLDQINSWQERAGEELGQGTVELLWRQVEPGGLPLLPAEAIEVAEVTLEEHAQVLEAVAQAEPLPPDRRMEQMLVRLDAPVQPLPPSPSKRLYRLFRYLRMGAAAAGTAWALYGIFSHGLVPHTLAEALLQGFGLIVATFGLIAAVMTYNEATKQAAPYWRAIQEQIADLPAGVALARVRRRSRRIYLTADVLISLALAAGLFLWLGEYPRPLLAIPASLFGIGFVLVLAARRKESQARRQVDALVQEVARPSLPQRRTADDLVRRQVRQYLGRMRTNLEEAGRNLFRLGADGQETSVYLRRLRTGPLAACQEETQTVHYRDGRYFASVWAPDEQVSRMLDLDETLLRRSQSLALDSETLYDASVDGDLRFCTPVASALDKDINQFRRLLGERAAFIIEEPKL